MSKKRGAQKKTLHPVQCIVDHWWTAMVCRQIGDRSWANKINSILDDLPWEFLWITRILRGKWFWNILDIHGRSYICGKLPPLFIGYFRTLPPKIMVVNSPFTEALFLGAGHEKNNVTDAGNRWRKSHFFPFALLQGEMKYAIPADSKGPFHPLVGGHLTPWKGHLTIPKRSLWITRYI